MTGVAAVVICATWLVPGSATQTLPSGPVVIRDGASCAGQRDLGDDAARA